MPLFSFRCEKCDTLMKDLFMPVHRDYIDCPYCTGKAYRKFEPANVIMHGITATGRFVPSLGRTISDVTEYNKAMKKAQLTEVSAREWEKEQDNIKRKKRDDVKKAKQKVKETLMRDPTVTAQGLVKEMKDAKIRHDKEAV